MRANGAVTCMVSGGFTLFTDRIAAMIGFDKSLANKLMIVDGHKLAGKVAEPIFGRNGKRAALIELRQELGLAKGDTMAIGDGANDLDMILEAGLGIAYHAKPKIAAAAHARIDHGNLTALLYVQGYRREEFVEFRPSDFFRRQAQAYCKLSATKLGSPSGVTTSSTAAFLPSFLSFSTRC